MRTNPDYSCCIWRNGTPVIEVLPVAVPSLGSALEWRCEWRMMVGRHGEWGCKDSDIRQ
jgi:hypothetical protein